MPTSFSFYILSIVIHNPLLYPKHDVIMTPKVFRSREAAFDYAHDHCDKVLKAKYPNGAVTVTAADNLIFTFHNDTGDEVADAEDCTYTFFVTPAVSADV